MTSKENELNRFNDDFIQIKLGRRKSDVTIILEWSVKRGLIKCNVAYAKGIYLEEIPTRLIPKEAARSSTGNKPQVVYEKIQMAIVLVKRDWGAHMYFMNEREDWTEEDYFQAADLLIKNRIQAEINNLGPENE